MTPDDMTPQEAAAELERQIDNPYAPPMLKAALRQVAQQEEFAFEAPVKKPVPAMPEDVAFFLAKVRQLAERRPTELVRRQAADLRVEWAKMLRANARWMDAPWFEAFCQEVFDELLLRIEKGILQ